MGGSKGTQREKKTGSGGGGHRKDEDYRIEVACVTPVEQGQKEKKGTREADEGDTKKK